MNIGFGHHSVVTVSKWRSGFNCSYGIYDSSHVCSDACVNPCFPALIHRQIATHARRLCGGPNGGLMGWGGLVRCRIALPLLLTELIRVSTSICFRRDGGTRDSKMAVISMPEADCSRIKMRPQIRNESSCACITKPPDVGQSLGF